MTVHTDFAGKIGVVDHGGLTVEGQSLLRRAVAHALEAPHKVQVPRSAAELAVCNNMVSGGLLLRHQLPDRRVLRGLQRSSVDLPTLKISAGLLQCGGAEETANEIIAKRRISFAHTVLLCIKKLVPLYGSGHSASSNVKNFVGANCITLKSLIRSSAAYLIMRFAAQKDSKNTAGL